MKKSKAQKILTKNKKPEKSLLLRIKRTGGRDSSGKISVRHIGGGARKMYRIVDFGQDKKNIKAKVEALEYDPNRTAFIALIKYADNEKRYILAPKGLEVGDEIEVGDKTEVKIGNRMKLKNIPDGEEVHNIELEPGRKGKCVRSAGAKAVVMAHDEGYVLLKMPSSEIRKFKESSYASIGAVSNPEHKFTKIGKAGRARNMGKRPSVRGSAMNPCDHPHGGGEGRAPIGLKYPKTPWGKHALGVRTRKKNKWSNKLIVKRRVKK
ncbi:MAG: 50S ribosomal protein L2 [Candidatus Pacebacteria bacterium]|nr:50S ribosomal protein L2 [Candidatus Paceibacterota bacterium]MDD2796477.1 50S ribosomal protein L2 [Candidatus Paceibacterota bacterium]MDD3047863.1 50S ribosomal protein L2 [Candidatus Paceibacterota bacterium]MDD3509920.1 50S ribosomal protein L2 [Candidatus Paceibacterota bacterium]MDD3918734.1 50S ribosomal protein L2 [Candidatus Paceibacterota bacterium]